MGQSPTKKAKKINNNQHILDGEKKSPLNFVDGDIHDKLYVALQKELDIDIITKLLKRGARVDNPIGAKTGKTALHVVQTRETNWFKSKFQNYCFTNTWFRLWRSNKSWCIFK